MILSAGILFVWQAYIAPEPPSAQKQKQEATATQEEPTDQAPDKRQAAQEAESKEASAQPDKPESQDKIAQGNAKDDSEDIEKRDVDVSEQEMKTEHLSATFSNRGGRLKSVLLTGNEQYRERGDLVGFPDDADVYPFETRFVEGNIDLPDNPVYRVVESESKKAKNGSYKRIVYRYRDPEGRFVVDKIFSRVPDKKYLVDLEFRVRNLLKKAPLVDSLALDIYGWKDPNQESSYLNFRPNQVKGVCHFKGETERYSIDSIEKPLRYDRGNVLWGAVDTRYFMLTGIPEKPLPLCSIQKVDGSYLRMRLASDDFSIAPRGEHTFEAKIFMGPKDLDLLGEIGHQLSASVDYGMFSFIARPLRWGLNVVQGWVVNWGWAIIILTIIIRLLISPINIKAYSSMERMKKIQPKLEEIRDKYEDDQQKMTEETMKLFREHDVSPLGGCLPMLLQMPILYGLYIMIYYSVELYHADFMLWYDNLSAPDPYYVLPVLMGVTMFAQQKMSSQSMGSQNQQAAVMMKVMPVVFTAFMLFLPAGLVLYYAISLIIGVGQQYYIKRKFSTQEA